MAARLGTSDGGELGGGFLGQLLTDGSEDHFQIGPYGVGIHVPPVGGDVVDRLA